MRHVWWPSSSSGPRPASTPSASCLQAQLTAAQLKLSRLHLETRSATLSKQLAVLTGLPVGSITPDHASIPEIPAVSADEHALSTSAIDSAQALAHSRALVAKGDRGASVVAARNLLRSSLQPQYHAVERHQFDYYTSIFQPKLAPDSPSASPFSTPAFTQKPRSPLLKHCEPGLRPSRRSNQNDIQITELTASLRELDAQAEVASLKQQIADEQLKSVLAQLELGNGATQRARRAAPAFAHSRAAGAH